MPPIVPHILKARIYLRLAVDGVFVIGPVERAADAIALLSGKWVRLV